MEVNDLTIGNQNDWYSNGAIIPGQVRGGEQHKGVARADLRRYLAHDPIEVRGRGLAVERGPDAHLAIKPPCRLCHFGRESLGVANRKAERRKGFDLARARFRPALVLIGIDADGEDVQLRLRRIGRAVVNNGGLREQPLRNAGLAE